jgi:hemoglobin
MKIRKIVLSLALVASLSAPVFAEDDPVAETKSLYERLGGETAIAAVVEDFVGRAASDPAVNFVRQGTPKAWDATPENVATLKKHLTQFLCSVTGGPQVYEGRDMITVHAGMQISDAEFNALAGDLQASLVSFNVPQQELDELMTIAASTRGQIVEQSEAPIS